MSDNKKSPKSRETRRAFLQTGSSVISIRVASRKFAKMWMGETP
jgi:hypothetical protein